MIFVDNFSPILLNLGEIQIRYYSLAYVLGFVFALWFTNFAVKKEWLPCRLTKKQIDDLLFITIISTILGGRLGYVLFYNLPYYIQNPSQILEVWHGGMSFHGALIGVLIGFALFCKKRKIKFLDLTDLIVLSAPIGVFFGRLANFINGELWGRPVSDASWGVIFPRKDMLPRHPSQLYEALLEGLILFLILNLARYIYTKREKIMTPGFLTGIGLVGYSIARIIIENFREPDAQVGFIFKHISMGQILSFPMLLIGTYLILRQYLPSKKRNKTNQTKIKIK